MGKWEKVQEEMQHLLSKEIAVRQEILGNMNQQEYLLLRGDLGLKEFLNGECNALVQELKKIVRCRGVLTRKLQGATSTCSQEAMLDQILNPLIEREGETLFLYEKTRELIGKMHGQQLRNKTLHATILKEGPSRIQNEAVRFQGGGKKQLITIDYPTDEKGEG